jgi:hypothetical protein
MDERDEGLARTPTAAWLAEQEAKQAAYEARRRAWTRRLKPRDGTGEDAVEDTAEPSPTAPGTTATGQDGRAARRRVPARAGARPAAGALPVLKPGVR